MLFTSLLLPVLIRYRKELKMTAGKDYVLCILSGVFLGMAVFCTLPGHSLFSFSLAHVSPAFVSITKLGEPVFSAIMAVFLFSEIPGALQIAGGLAVIAGIVLYLLNIETKRKQQE